MNAKKNVLLALIALAVSSGIAHATTTTMSATPNTVTVTYTKGTGAGAAQTTVVKPSAGSIYFTVDAAVPDWLLVTPDNGSPTSTSGTTLSLSASPYAASLGSGQYTGTVTLHSSGIADATITVNLVVKSAAATIASTPSTVNITNWNAGATLPTQTLLVQSSGDPVTFSVAPKYTNPTTAWFTISTSSYVAYSWGTTLTFNFSQSAFDNATIGKSLTGSVVITPSNGGTPITVSVTVAVGGPTATVTSVKPPKLPVVTSGTNTRTVAVSGTNFFDGMNVHVNSASPLTNNCSTFAAAKTEALCIQSSSLLYVKLTESTDLRSAGTITLNVGAATGTVTVTTNPIVYSVTNSASFVEPSSGNPSVSPYEILTIFGDNFTSSTVYGAVASGKYGTALTDGAGNQIEVGFFLPDTSTPLDTPLTHDPLAALLLATPTQINLIVPSSLPSPGTAAAQLAVNYNSLVSDPVALDVVAAQPGLFTTSSGLNQAVAVLPDGSVNSSSNPAVSGTNSYITLYMAGLGAPDSTGATTDPGPALTCLSVANYITAQGSSWNTMDGAVIDSTLFGTYNVPPCLATPPTVTIGGVDFTSHVTYAGWVAGSVTGLYQVNVALPSGSLTGATKVPTSGAPAGASGSNPYYITVAVGSASSPSSAVYVYLK